MIIVLTKDLASLLIRFILVNISVSNKPKFFLGQCGLMIEHIILLFQLALTLRSLKSIHPERSCPANFPNIFMKILHYSYLLSVLFALFDYRLSFLSILPNTIICILHELIFLRGARVVTIFIPLFK